MFDALVWHAPSVQEAVYFLPVEARGYEGYAVPVFLSLAELFENVKNLKIVFYPEREGQDGDGKLVAPSAEDSSVTLDDIVVPLSQFIVGLDTTTIYGFEQLRGVPGGALCETCESFVLSTASTRKSLSNEARGDLLRWIYPKDEDFEFVDDPGEEGLVSKTLKEYPLLDTDRRHEVNADD